MRRSLAIAALGLVSLAILASGCAAATEGNADASSAIAAGEPRVIVTLRLDDWGAGIATLARGSFDVAGVNVEASEVDVVVTAEERTDLERQGFTIVRETPAPIVEPGVDPAAGYKSPDDVRSLVNDWAARYPNIANATSIGRTNEGRDMWAIAIGNPATPSPKPRILFNAAHHAREVMTVEVAIDTIQTLLEGYGSDPKITHWVDANEIWIVPMVNPDGSARVASGDTMRRKNTRGCPASGSCTSTTGVDINRNYTYGWGSCNGSSSRPGAEDYRGPNAGSEPETRAMMNLVDRIRPVFDISYHSYSELVLYPYSCSGQYSAARGLFETIGRELAQRLPSDSGSGRFYRPGTPWEILYSADGGDMDWMHHDFSVVAFALELNGQMQGFRPNYAQWRQKTVTKARGAWQLLLDRLDAGGVRGVVRTTDGLPLTGAQVEVTSGSATQARPVNPDGSFHVVLLPGSYHVRVSAPGHAALDRDVTVGGARVDLDATLR